MLAYLLGSRFSYAANARSSCIARCTSALMSRPFLVFMRMFCAEDASSLL